MTVRSSKRIVNEERVSVSKKELSRRTASRLLDLVDSIRLFTGWAILRGRSKKLYSCNIIYDGDPIEDALYDFGKKTRDGEVKVINTFGNSIIYLPMFSEYSDTYDEVKGETIVRVGNVDNIEILYDPKTDPVLVTRCSTLYFEYPPRTVESLLFYTLNHHIEKRVKRLIFSGNLDLNKIKKYIDVYFEIIKKISMSRDKINLAIKLSFPSNVSIETMGRIEMSHHPAFRVFESIDASYNPGSENIVYSISFRENDDYLVYDLEWGAKTIALSKLLEYIVPTEELAHMNTLIDSIDDALSKTYLFLRVVDKIQ